VALTSVGWGRGRGIVRGAWARCLAVFPSLHRSSIEVVHVLDHMLGVQPEDGTVGLCVARVDDLGHEERTVYIALDGRSHVQVVATTIHEAAHAAARGAECVVWHDERWRRCVGALLETGWGASLHGPIRCAHSIEEVDVLVLDAVRVDRYLPWLSPARRRQAVLALGWWRRWGIHVVAGVLVIADMLWR
jgi:hypothetical protein